MARLIEGATTAGIASPDLSDAVSTLQSRSNAADEIIDGLGIQFARASLHLRAGPGNTSLRVFEVIDGAEYNFRWNPDYLPTPALLESKPSDKAAEFRHLWILERGGPYTWSYLVAHRYRQFLDIVLEDGTRYVTRDASIAEYEENPSLGGAGYARLSTV